MEEELKEMLGKRPDELEGETLRLFNAIMKIADERDELKLKYKELKEIEESHRKENGELRERVKQLEENKLLLNSKIGVDLSFDDYIPVSLVEEEITKLKEQYNKVVNEINNQGMIDQLLDFKEVSAKLEVCEELLEKRK